MSSSVYPARQHVLKTFKELVKLLPPNERHKPQVMFMAGGVTEFRNDTDRELIFRQESNFYYLTGCHVPSSLLIATYHQPPASNEAEASLHLFIPKAELADIMWSVPPPSLEEAKGTHDATTIEHPSSLPTLLSSIIQQQPEALFHTLPANSPLFPLLPSEYTKVILTAADDSIGITDAYLLPALHRARLTKDEHEISLIRQANAISSRAHEVVMRVLGAAVRGEIQRQREENLKRDKEVGVSERPLLPSEWLIETEGEAEAIFVASCRREGSNHQAYPPIVAASTRASTLHYCCNDKAFAWGPIKPHDHLNRGQLTDKELNPQVLLIDAGCEHTCYASDITRTMPVGNGGKFTKEAGEIYELVLEMQKASLDAIQPGAHWDTIQLICHQVLIRGFQRLGIFKSPTDEESILASGISAAFFPHGVGHSLGLDVHDVPSASKPDKNDTIPKDANGNVIGHESCYTYLRLRLPLEEGMVVTVEPGIYFSPHLLAPILSSPHLNTSILALYQPVGGIRIEDVIVIKEAGEDGKGYENLTTVRSDREWVESVCAGEL
ncbi:prolidase [Coprinopsis cinerea okayama7|uniref:Prolidase n=1 Tax=Coprinopsis cinerea (strain Okayama-7 / 130 / ATCC MYA-4618 / FGSC 9003) TaxID=240176 RepID=D6RM67_COPC7|nr:prolidase [Coprinopsis cinerea okayama7\|eukprot:XP_002911336.1 prolidase [Coprinopsis cinerea okayama7\